MESKRGFSKQGSKERYIPRKLFLKAQTRVWDREAAGSNLVTRTNFKEKPPITVAFLRLMFGIYKVITNRFMQLVTEKDVRRWSPSAADFAKIPNAVEEMDNRKMVGIS